MGFSDPHVLQVKKLGFVYAKRTQALMYVHCRLNSGHYYFLAL